MSGSQRAVANFAPFAGKMLQAGLPQIAIDNFRYYYGQLVEGATGYIDRDEARPVHSLPDYAFLTTRDEEEGARVLDRAVVFKLNGGLGTSMGMSGPKSLLIVKNGLSFLDIIVQQVQHMRNTYGARLPLVLMNSFSTRAESLKALARYPDFVQDIPFDFLQHKEPKIWKDTLAPAVWPGDPDKEWCPPGHGDIYPALVTDGLLEALLTAGYDYAFVSNADNLGAELDLRILGYVAARHVPFLMEVANRTPADRKGGHLAQRPDGHLILRESAQCPPDEEEEFQDIGRFRYFNTNNLWIDLRALDHLLEQRQGVIPLPLIRNEKPVDPAEPTSPRVYQLETAMGSAIAVFEDAQAMCVPRDRFVPVKKNSDLLVLMSDAYVLSEDYTLQLAPKRNGVPPVVQLDDRYYQLFGDLALRFPQGAPSLAACTKLEVVGDVRFGANVKVEGTVQLQHEGAEPLLIADNTTLQGE